LGEIVDDLLDVCGDAAEKHFAVEDNESFAMMCTKSEGFASSEFEKMARSRTGLEGEGGAGVVCDLPCMELCDLL